MSATDDDLQTDLTFTAEINLYYDLLVPPDLKQRAPLLIAVHGYGAHKRYMMREASLIAPDGFILASIEGPHQHYRQKDEGYRVGFGWLTDHRSEDSVSLHHNFLIQLIRQLDEQSLVDTSQVWLFGFSQACALNFRFAFTYPEILAGIIGVCGGVPGDLETNPIYRPFPAKTLYMYGDDDEFYTQEQFAGFDKELRDRLPNYRSIHYRAKHEITNEMRADMREFLSFGLAGHFN